jgi:hypothetical protein
MILVLFPSTKQRDMAGRWLRPATLYCTMIRKRLYLLYDVLGGLGGPLGSTARFSKPTLAGAYPDTWLSLSESHVWRYETLSMSILKV